MLGKSYFKVRLHNASLRDMCNFLHIVGKTYVRPSVLIKTMHWQAFRPSCRVPPIAAPNPPNCCSFSEMEKAEKPTEDKFLSPSPVLPRRSRTISQWVPVFLPLAGGSEMENEGLGGDQLWRETHVLFCRTCWARLVRRQARCKRKVMRERERMVECEYGLQNGLLWLERSEDENSRHRSSTVSSFIIRAYACFRENKEDEAVRT